MQYCTYKNLIISSLQQTPNDTVGLVEIHFAITHHYRNVLIFRVSFTYIKGRRANRTIEDRKSLCYIMVKNNENYNPFALKENGRYEYDADLLIEDLESDDETTIVFEMDLSSIDGDSDQ